MFLASSRSGQPENNSRAGAASALRYTGAMFTTADIVLTTINARYVHAALGLRYLAANMGELAPRTRIVEFVLGQRAFEIVEDLLALNPRIIGLGVYIWNVEECTRVVALLKKVAPHITVILGGPEVSYETDEQRICTLADHVITGWGDVTFAQLAAEIVSGATPAQKVIVGEQPPLAEIILPYAHYTDEDIAKRFIYVEASRGCPFKCEFCLSALDKTAWPFELDAFMAEIEKLYNRGARNFRFVDRTFNLKVAASERILEFFLARMDDNLFMHFELIPDHLPDKLKETIARFPPGALHIGKRNAIRRQYVVRRVGVVAQLMRFSMAVYRRAAQSLEDTDLYFVRLQRMQPVKATAKAGKVFTGQPGDQIDVNQRV